MTRANEIKINSEVQIDSCKSEDCTGEIHNCTPENAKVQYKGEKIMNYSDDELIAIKNHTAELLPHFLSPARGGGYICPYCGNGSGKDGTGINILPNNPHVVNCFKCGKAFNIFQIVQKVQGTNFSEAVKTCAELTGERISGNGISSAKKAPSTLERENKPVELPKDFTDYYNTCQATLLDPQKNIRAMEYLKSRGLDDFELINRFKIGYDNFKNTIVIPHNKSFYTARAIANDNKRFSNNPKNTHVSLFNAEALHNPDSFIFITEGTFDALSLIKVGVQAVSVGGVTNYKTLIRALEGIENKPRFIILFDPDTAGRNNSINLEKALINIKAFSANEILPLIDGDEKTDANKWLQFNADKLKEITAQIISNAQEKFKNWTPFISTKEVKGNETLPGVKFDYETPTGYVLNLDGLYIFAKNGLKRLANPIIVTKLVENVDEGIYKTALACFKDGKWRYSPAVDNDIIASKNKITALAKFDIDVTSTTASAIVDYIQKFVDTNRAVIPTSEQISHTGWRDDDFSYPILDSKFELDDTIKQQVKYFTSKGSKETVLDLIKELKTIHNFNMALGATLAAPLVHIFNAENIVIHFYGLAGCGKSTISKAVASLFVNPFVSGSLPSANATASALEYLFNGRRDLPCLIEDIGAVDQLDKRTQATIKNLPYQFGNGIGRMRAKAQGGNREIIEIRGSLITNDEKPLTSINSKGGAIRRVIELECAKDMITPEKASRIDTIIRDNYGLFGADWIKYIQTNKVEIISKYKEIRQRMFKQYGIFKVPRHIDQISSICAALVFFNKFVGFDDGTLADSESEFKDTKTDRNELDCCGYILDKLPDNSSIADFERVKPIIRDWYLQHQSNFIDDSQNDETTAPKYNDSKNYDTYGIIKKDFVAVYPKVIREMLENEGFAPDMIIKQLIDDGFLLHDNDKLCKRIRINEGRVYVIAISKEKLFK